MLFNKKKKFPNYLSIQPNKLISLGCPCSTLEDGSCNSTCHKINSEKDPCVDCPISSVVYIAIVIKKEMDSNELITLNMQKPIVMHLEIFPGKLV